MERSNQRVLAIAASLAARLLITAFVICSVATSPSAADGPRRNAAARNPVHAVSPFAAAPMHPDVLQTQDLSSGLTLEDIIAALLGTSAIAISNARFTGSESALGTFLGGTGIIGFEQGIVLSSGHVASVVGPNTNGGVTSAHFRPGDPDLDSLIPGFTTEDACILEFDFECPSVRAIGFEYVFSSDEYNEFVYNSYNDVFGFFVNGENVALLPDGKTVVSIDNVNGGNPSLPDSAASNPQYYRNNDECQFSTVPSCPINTEMDGLTTVLIADALINPGINHIKLAVADVGDGAWDSNVFLKGQSFVCGAVNNTAPVCEIVPAGPITVTAGANVTFTVSGTDADTGQTIYLSVLFNIPFGATMNPPLPRAGSNTGLSSQFNWQPTQPGTYFANFLLTDSLGGVDSCEAQIEVLPAVNTAPACVFNPPGPFNVNVGVNLTFDVIGTDPDDGQSIYLHQFGPWPGGISMNPSLPLAGSRTGLTSQFSWTPTQGGSYLVRFLLTDSLGGSDTAIAQIIVSAAQLNQPPVCVISPPGPFTITAGNTLAFTVTGTDLDIGQSITLSAFGALPPGATMNPPLPVSGANTGVTSQFSWTPSEPGNFVARFFVIDPEAGSDTAVAQIAVIDGTAPRVISVSPSDGVSEVSWNTPAMIEFSEPVIDFCNMLTIPEACVTASSRRQGGLLTSQVWKGELLLVRAVPVWPDDDTISITVSGNVSDAAGNRLDGDSDGIPEGSPVDDFTFSFSTAPGVYPGDANDDGIVDERDVLPLGVHFLRTGPGRDRNFEVWALEAATAWSPREATHADCDGNGIVDSNDVCAILEFFDRVVPAKRGGAGYRQDALSVLDQDVRAALSRALVDCNRGSTSARAVLLEALAGQPDAGARVPASFQLGQNYPNPFNAGTSIQWGLEVSGQVDLIIFDILGRRVRKLVDKELTAGFHTANWDGTDDEGHAMASGVYIYRLSTGIQSVTKRMVLIR